MIKKRDRLVILQEEHRNVDLDDSENCTRGMIMTYKSGFNKGLLFANKKKNKHMLRKIENFYCHLIGWNPEILAECSEASFALMKKYVSAIFILSLLWGTIDIVCRKIS